MGACVSVCSFRGLWVFVLVCASFKGLWVFWFVCVCLSGYLWLYVLLLIVGLLVCVCGSFAC